MDKITQLWIRACKSKDPATRLRSVYRRFYLDIEYDQVHVAMELQGIICKFELMTVRELARALSPHRTSAGLQYSERLTIAYCNAIRFAGHGTLKGLTPPRRFRT